MTFLELAKARYSVRAFKNTPVEKEKIEAILEAAKIALTAKNSQPQKIYVAQSAEALAIINEESPCIYGAPVVFVIGYDKNRECKVEDVRPGYGFGEQDASIVQTHMILEAADQGLGSCWVGYYKETIREKLGLPENVEVTGLLPVGYPADSAEPSPRHTLYRDDAEMVEYI